MQRLVSVQPVAIGLTHLVFDQPPADHAHAGQYVVVVAPEHAPKPGAKGFFALASAPGAPAELLLKGGGDVADWLIDARPGAQVDLGPARGPGWGVPDGPEPVVLLVNGSGISAVRPLVPSLLDAGREVILLLGALSEAHVPFADELTAWERRGAQVRMVWDHAPIRFVQDAAAHIGLLRPDVTVVLCGHNAMVDAAKQMWTAVGTPAHRIRTNF